MSEDPAVLAEKFAQLKARIQKKRDDMEAFGTLNGEARIVASEAEVELTRLQESANGSNGGATDAAVLRTALEEWTAKVDRHFKAD